MGKQAYQDRICQESLKTYFVSRRYLLSFLSIIVCMMLEKVIFSLNNVSCNICNLFGPYLGQITFIFKNRAPKFKMSRRYFFGIIQFGVMIFFK